MDKGCVIYKKTRIGALIRDAKAGAGPAFVMNLETLGALSVILNMFRGFYGGLWVGGDLLLFEDRLEFRPNLLNKLAHREDEAFKISYSHVTSVRIRPGMFTKIIDFELIDGHQLFRCYGASQLLIKIRKLINAPNV